MDLRPCQHDNGYMDRWSQTKVHLLGNKVSPIVYPPKFNELVSQYDGYTRIFTDGSKIGEAVGSVAIMTTRLCKKRLPNN